MLDLPGERTRFQSLVPELTTPDLQTPVLAFFNAVLNYGPGTDRLEFRLHLRYELLMLGIQPLLDELRGSRHSPLLDRTKRLVSAGPCRHQEPERHVRGRTKEAVSHGSLPTSHVDHASSTASSRLVISIHPPGVGVEHGKMDCAVNYGASPHHWLLVDRCIQQIVLQGPGKDDPDLAPLDIDVRELVKLLATEEEVRTARDRASALEEENAELTSQLSKKDHELEKLAQEKEDFMNSLNKLKTRLEKETLGHLEAVQKVADLEYRLADVTRLSKLEGTLWEDLGDPRLYKDINLLDLDRAFSAYQRQASQQCNGGSTGGGGGSVEDLLQQPASNTGSLRGVSHANRAPRELSVIDGRRAQNCTILLSKLRMTNEDICRAILSMDHPREQLPKDMVEQLLKFVPSAEEKALLEEHSMEIESMARADRFLFEISRIVHYEQRIKTLYYKKKFQERISDCKPKIMAVLDASKEIQRSKKLKKLLDLVLAIGNYMNRGQRGNALGFRLLSLNRIADTKSSNNRNVTLLHFIAATAEKKFKDLLKLEDDMPHARQAAKVKTCIKFCVKNEIKCADAFRMLTVAYGEATLDRSNVYRWYKMFSEGREDVNDEERAGRPSTSTTDEKINEVEKMILANRRITVREVAEDLNISIDSCHSIFINDLGMRRVAAKFVPKLLNCDQAQHRMEIANEMLDSVRDDPNLLQRVITGDEAWVYGYDVETKAQSSQWKLPHEPRPKKARQVRSNVKVLLTVFFDCRGVVHHEFSPQGRTVNKEYYLQAMRNLREAIRQKRPDLWKNKNWLLHHDNAPAHTSLLVREFLAKNNTLMMPQQPYSPDLAPCDFFLFPKLKRPMKGRLSNVFHFVFSMLELSKEIQSLKTGLQEVQREMEFHRGQPSPPPGDKFLAVMKDFMTGATYRLSDLDDSFHDMKSRYERTVRLFGEDPSQIQPDEFFGILDVFLTTFADARADNVRRREEDEKRSKQEAEINTLDVYPAVWQRRHLGEKTPNESPGGLNGVRTLKGGPSDKGEFDDLISALRTGDVFGEDLAKFRRSKRRGASPHGSPSTWGASRPVKS
ncbi:DAAM2 [Cordylochernes scorpioides]|uniref:DAAM2 n=1 Tax=Cordylochernes scorpioides TaxID=51811 RepID=A0ABY6KJL2_9ARAC|nr:DAAM2 [Cordylochernes scorpioides]